MRVLLLTIGSHGDVHPFIDIAAALQRAGHEAVLATNPLFQQQIEKTGIAFESLMDRVDIRDLIRDYPVMDAVWGPLVVMRQLILPDVPALVKRSRELIRSLKPDAVVYHPILFGAPWACQLEGGPRTISVSPSPLLWCNPRDTMVLMPGRSANPWKWSVQMDVVIGKLGMRLALDPGLNRVRRSLGLPKLKDQLRRAATDADLNLGIWSPLFRAPLEGDPAKSVVTGFTWHDRDPTQQTPDPELLSFLDAGDPPIVFSLGSTGVHAPQRFFEHAVVAAQSLGARALLVVGRDQPTPSNMPKDSRFKAVAYAPYSVVFPRASVVVHHGGAGTTAQGLRSGRPSVVTPMAHDQFDNAARVQRMHAGKMLRFYRVTAKRLAKVIAAVQSDPACLETATRLAAGLRREDGAVVAARCIASGWSEGPASAEPVDKTVPRSG